MIKIFASLFAVLFLGKFAYAQLDFLAEDEAKSPEQSQQQENVLDSYIQDLEEAAKAQADARKMLYEKPKILQTVEEKENIAKKRDEKIERLREKYGFGTKVVAEEKNNENKSATVISEDNADSAAKQVENKPKDQQPAVVEAQATADKQSVEEKQPDVAENTALQAMDAAPFGLYWGASSDDLQKNGTSLEKVQDKEFENVYLIKNAVQKQQTFTYILGRFGQSNRLWNIYAESSKTEDDAKATKVLELYHKYYNALARKYGNAKEIFKPYVVEETAKDDEEKEKVVKKTNPMGGDNFLQELQEEKAILYATFGDGKIAANLSVNVDKEGLSYIAVDYRNLPLIQKEKQEVFEQILDDL